MNMRSLTIGLILIAALVAGYFVFRNASPSNESTGNATSTSSGSAAFNTNDNLDGASADIDAVMQ